MHCCGRFGRQLRCYLRRRLDTFLPPDHLSFMRHGFADVRSMAREGISVMRSVSSFLRQAPSRLKRRLVQIVEIAAASLPSAGA